MYKNILVPVLLDENHDTDAAFRAAQALADAGAKLTVLHVLEAIPSYVASQVPDEVLTQSRHGHEEALGKVAASLPGAVTQMGTGHPGRFIVDYARDHSVDCIIVASHQPGLEDYFLGSTAARVVRHAQCAVHVIR